MYEARHNADVDALTSFNRRIVPDRMTVPVSRQMAVSAPPSSSMSSDRLSRPFTRFTMLYNSTNELGSFIKQFGGLPGWKLQVQRIR
jgi:hypothetical protein